MEDLNRINNTMGKMRHYLNTHNSICVGVSGGSDSNIIVHIIATYFRDMLPKIHFMFSNTGTEYQATLKHLDYMESRYNIHIDRIKGEPIPAVIKKYGFPILSKHFSGKVQEAANGSQSALKRINGTATTPDGKRSKFCFSEKQRNLAEYLLDNKIAVSDKCCMYSKKKPLKKYLKEIKADLSISGERKFEGGLRSRVHSSCYEPGKDGIDKYMPLFFWDDDTKEYFKEREGIIYSDCYEVWGMKRTGCVGCPFNSKVGEELEIIKKYEPRLYKLCMHIFGESYRLMDEFEVHKEKIFK